MKRLKRNGQLEEYDTIIKEQLEEGIVEEAAVSVTGREFYIPQKPFFKFAFASKTAMLSGFTG